MKIVSFYRRAQVELNVIPVRHLVRHRMSSRMWIVDHSTSFTKTSANYQVKSGDILYIVGGHLIKLSFAFQFRALTKRFVQPVDLNYLAWLMIQFWNVCAIRNIASIWWIVIKSDCTWQKKSCKICAFLSPAVIVGVKAMVFIRPSVRLSRFGGKFHPRY